MKKVKVQEKDYRGFFRKLFNMKDEWGHEYNPIWMEAVMEDDKAIAYHVAVSRNYNVIIEDI
jgi:hypothetical protein